jgi:hypothetical protein
MAMSNEAGKGDKQRPTDHNKFSENYDQIFGYQTHKCVRCGETAKVKKGVSWTHTCTPIANWPFPSEVIETNGKPPKFNPDNYEDAPL